MTKEPPMPGPKRYRVRGPVEVDAMQLVDIDDATIRDWLTERGVPFAADPDRLFLGATDGYTPVAVGEWIVEGVTGRFFKLTTADFEGAYEPAE
jgi:hypothetical protein